MKWTVKEFTSSHFRVLDLGNTHLNVVVVSVFHIRNSIYSVSQVWKCLLVKGHHAPSNGHVHRNLRRHAADQDHLLAGVGMESRIENIFSFPQFIFRQTRRHYALPRRRQTQPLTRARRRHELPLPSAILVVTDDFVCMGQLVVREEDVPGVCDSEEVFSPTQKCALVPPGLLDVYGGG